MATLTVQEINRAGITPSFAAATVSGDQFPNGGGRVFAEAKNTSGAPITVTTVTQATIDGLAVTDLTVSIPATTGDKMWGPFPSQIYEDANGFVQLTYSGVTNLTIAAFRLP